MEHFLFVFHAKLKIHLYNYSSFCFLFLLPQVKCEKNLTNSWTRETILSQLNLTESEYRELTSLDLSSKDIANFDENSFKNLAKLTSLDLSYNQLDCLDESLFKDLKSLEDLSLYNNKINLCQSLYSRVFQN